jgi:hypothetical protein
VRSARFIIALIAIAGWPVHATAAEPKPPVAYFLDHASNLPDVPINLPLAQRMSSWQRCAS